MAPETLRSAARSAGARVVGTRVRKLERVVVLLAAWAVEDRDVALAALTASEVCHRGLMGGRADFAAAECSKAEFYRRFSEQFVRNVKRRLGKRIDLSRPERVKAARRGR